MKTLKRRVGLLLAAVIASFALSTPLMAASGVSTGRIKRILWYEGHTGVLVGQENMSDLGGCGRGDLYILDDQHPFFKEIYALLLTAHTVDMSLAIHIDGCVMGIPRIKHVDSIK